MKFEIKLSSIPDVKQFVKIAMDIPEDVSVTSGKYTVDGKSIMGIFSLDLSNMLIVEVDEKYFDRFHDIGRKED